MRRIQLVRVAWLVVMFMALSVLTPSTALAYIDPIAGSLIFQAIIAGVLGAVVTMKGAGSALKGAARRIWQRLKG